MEPLGGGERWNPVRGSGSQGCGLRDVVLPWLFPVVVSEVSVCH